jgi:Mn-dependent DtxR family transcriptional regulator
MLNSTERDVLVALVRLARSNRHATAIRVATAIGAHPESVREALRTLDGKGLVDAERVRVTLNGLALSMALASSVEVRSRRTRRPAVKTAA